MGKPEDADSFPSTASDAQGGAVPNAALPARNGIVGCPPSCFGITSLLGCKCVFVLLLGCGVLLSAVFWLPFLDSGVNKDLDLEYAGYDIVATFMLKKPVSFLKNNTLQLENDVFDEMSFASTKVEILSIRPSTVLNATKVVFAVETDATTRSLIRGNYESLVTHQTPFQFSGPLFGDPFSFDVLKFRGGLTVAPYQKAYLLQSVQILFNFTLNFSIGATLNNFDELVKQLQIGLHLSTYENLYIRLTNLKGSTVDPPTTVQSQVLLAVGINPSKSRLKQLAQTITGSHGKNLGLNNTVFGRVKQVSLSSVLQHSLDNNTGSPSPSPSPSTSPMAKPYHHHHDHHRNHHHVTIAPRISPSPSTVSSESPIEPPSPAPAPRKSLAASPRPGCHFGYKNKFPWKNKYHYPIAPNMPPAHAPSRSKQTHHITAPRISPVPATSPSSNVAHAHRQPPSHNVHYARPPESMPLTSPAPTPSSACHIQPLTLLMLVGLYF